MPPHAFSAMLGLAEEGMSMLRVIHQMGFVRKAADWVVFMDAGRIVEIKTPDEFFERPQNEHAQRFAAQILH